MRRAADGSLQELSGYPRREGWGVWPRHTGGVVKARPGVRLSHPNGSFVSPGAPLLPSGP